MAALMGAATRLVAQGTETWTPDAPSMGVGVFGVTGDGESSRRLGLTWHRAPGYDLLLSTRFWGDYTVAEVEVRFTNRRPREVNPYFSVSGLWQEHTSRQSVGATLGGGVEYCPVDRVVFSGTLAWQSLFGVGGPWGNDWFRVTVGLSLVPFS